MKDLRTNSSWKVNFNTSIFKIYVNCVFCCGYTGNRGSNKIPFHSFDITKAIFFIKKTASSVHHNRILPQPHLNFHLNVWKFPQSFWRCWTLGLTLRGVWHIFRMADLPKENSKILVGSLKSSQIVWANFGWHGKLLFGLWNFWNVWRFVMRSRKLSVDLK